MYPASQNAFTGLSFRVRVGVVGAGLEPGQLSARFDRIFPSSILTLFNEAANEKIDRAGKSRTEIAFSIVTSLGSDVERLFARNALALEGTTLEVVLPCSKTAFVREFVGPVGSQDFDDLFKRARRPIALRKRIPTSSVDTRSRELTAETWRYIADHSDVVLLLAGADRGDHDFEEFAEYVKGKGIPMILVGANEESVVPGRGLNADAIGGLARFNAFRLEPGRLESEIEKAYRSIFGSDKGNEPRSRSLVREFLLPHYVRAELIAKKNQRIYQTVGILVYSLSAVAVGAVAFGTLAHHWSVWAFGLELLLLVAILAMVLWADRNRTHRNWIETRFLAERLRAAQFLLSCDTEVTPMDAPPLYGETGHKDDWTMMAFNEIWRRVPPMSGLSKESFAQHRDFITSKWLDDQIAYHGSKVTNSKAYSHYLEKGGIIVFACALAAAASHLLFFYLHLDWLELPLTFAAIVLPSVGAAIGGIRTHREFSRLSKRSENMIQSINELKLMLERAKTPGEFEDLLRKIEQTMLIESQDWLMLMRFAELEAAA